MADERIACELTIHGRVQGVCFRASTRDEACRIGVHGYARNNEDGTVTVVVEGEANAVGRLVEWCRGGPTGARVDEVVESARSVTGYDSFDVRFV
ncbi:MAG: acylphosphatase [Planctomycetota bacterium]